MNWNALAVAVALVVSVVGAPVASSAVTTQPTATQQAEGAAYVGSNVAFDVSNDAIVNYTVNGERVVDGMAVQSAASADGEAGAGVDVGAGSDVAFSGAGLSVANDFSAGASTSATIQSESGAELETHDNERGIVVIRSNGERQAARFDGSAGADARTESEKRAVLTSENGTATVIVVGEGNVTVSDDGNVTATTGPEGRVVYRQYDEARSDSEKQQERLIANGTAVAEVYVQSAADAASDGDDDTPTATPTEEPSDGAQERSADVVNYSEDTTVEVTERSATTVNATVERSQSEGKVVIMSVTETAFENAEDAEVYVDGEAAVEADSYSEVESAADGGDRSAFLVRQSSSAEAATDVVVGINHFSARDVSMQSGSDDGSDTETSAATVTDTPSDTQTDAATDADGSDGDDGTETGGQPGFGAVIAVVALIAAALVARSRR